MSVQTGRRSVALLDLAALHGPLRDRLLEAMARVVDSRHYVLGEPVDKLESGVAAYCGARYGIACASGTDALFLALLAAGLGPGDEVLTTPFTFFATAGAVTRCGARPVFVDIDAQTLNLDAGQLVTAARRHPKARAVIPVHLYGGSADMDPILETARRHGLIVIEDGAQSIGAEYKGRRTQGLGQMGCLSFYPTKNLGALGDAGMVVTSDPDLAGKLRALRVHGSRQRYLHEWVGINSRMDTLQAAVLLAMLPHLDGWTEGRRRNAAWYQRALGGLELRLPVPAGYQSRHVFHQFVVRSRHREQLRAHLTRCGVGTEVYYPVPLHLQGCYRQLGYQPGAFPESELAAQQVLALPVHSGLSQDDLDYVSAMVKSFQA